jgi:hypothetical protein
MRSTRFAFVLGGSGVLAILVACALAAAQQQSNSQKTEGGGNAAIGSDGATHEHVTLTPDQLKWGDAPPSLPRGGQMAVLEGDPGKAGPFTIRFKSPANFKVPPHWHSVAENITVIEGTFYIGDGDTFDKSKMTALPVGGFTSMPAKMHHFAYMEQPGIIQIHGMGPFDIHYINPDDDPRRK